MDDPVSLTRTLILLYVAGTLFGRGWAAMATGQRNAEAVQLACGHTAVQLGSLAELGRWLNGEDDGDTIVRGTQ